MLKKLNKEEAPKSSGDEKTANFRDEEKMTK